MKRVPFLSVVLPSIALLVWGCLMPVDSAQAQQRADVFVLLAGVWGGNQENTCRNNPHTIAFSNNNRRATFTYRSAPRNRYERSRIPPERQSPEVSATNVIHFDVLASGDSWVALRREGEDKLDRLGKPRSWKLSLGSDLTSYGWWLYNSVVWKKSFLRGERCPEGTESPGLSVVDNSDADSRSSLESLVGRWEAKVNVMGKPVIYRAEGQSVLQGEFLRLTVADVTRTASYESVIYIGRSKTRGDYVAHWMDIYGADSSRFIGEGDLEGNVLTLTFRGTDSDIRHVFRLRTGHLDAGNGFDLLVTSSDKGGTNDQELVSFRFKRTR